MALSIASKTTQLRDLTMRFIRGVNSVTNFYDEIAYVVDSEGAEEKYGWLGAMPGMREWLGDRVFNEIRAADYELKNKHWESSVLIEKTDIRDARLLKYDMAIDQLAEEAAYHPDELTIQVLLAGESKLCWDGQYFFDTDHAWGASGTQSNDLTYAAATGTTPTAAEFKGAFHQARAAMLKFKNDQGKPFIRPTTRNNNLKLMALVHPDIEEQATEGLTAALTQTGGTNVVLSKADIVPVSGFTDPSKWILLNLSQRLKPLVFQRREPLKQQIKNLDDIEHKAAKFMTEARYNVGYLAWWNAVLTTFT